MNCALFHFLGFQSLFTATTMEESSKRLKPESIVDLPYDTLLLILSRLDDNDFQSLSLVSKHFLILSNNFIRKLTFKTLPTDLTFTKIFTRFASVSQITICSTRVCRALIVISNSKLNLEALRIVRLPSYPTQHQMISLAGRLKIKSLSIDWFSKDGVDRVVEFIQLFPSLEELNFQVDRKWDDAGIESLSLVVPNLRKINLSGNYHLTDRALYALSTNCVNLEQFVFVGSVKFTPQGICTFLLTSRNLTYMDFLFYLQFPDALHLPLAEAVSACENLQHLSLSMHLIKDAALCVISKSNAPLTTLKMISYGRRPLNDYTMRGLSAMLFEFQGLQELEICLPCPESDKLIDKKMSEVVKSLLCLHAIFIISFCPIYATLFSLIENCPLIERICLNMILSARERRRKVPVPQLIRKNYNVKCISLDPKPESWFKIALGSYCPFLKKMECNNSS